MIFYQRGWVSFPILLVVMIFGILLVRQQSVIHNKSNWQTQKSLTSQSDMWDESYQLLTHVPATNSSCVDFCSPKTQSWLLKKASFGKVWLQKLRVDSLAVERWCVTRDQQLMRCWWIHDDGRYSTMLLNN